MQVVLLVMRMTIEELMKLCPDDEVLRVSDEPGASCPGRCPGRPHEARGRLPRKPGGAEIRRHKVSASFHTPIFAREERGRYRGHCNDGGWRVGGRRVGDPSLVRRVPFMENVCRIIRRAPHRHFCCGEIVLRHRRLGVVTQ